MSARSKNNETFDGDGPIASALRRHEALALAILLAFAALFRVFRWSATAVIFNDGPVFLSLAEAMAEGKWAMALSHAFHPLYPALIAAVHPVIGDWELAGVAVNVTGGTAAVACLYGFARAAFDRNAAFAAAAILAVHPHAIEFSGDVQSEGLYLGLFLATVWALWRALRHASLGAAMIAGLLCGLAYLTRPEGIGLLGVGGAIAAWHALRRSWSRRRAAAWGALLFLSAACVVGPYVAWLRVETGDWFLTQKKSVGWVAGLEGPPSHFATTPALGEAPPRPREDAPPTSAEPEPEAPKPAQPPSLARYGEALLDLLRTDLRAFRPELLALLLAGGLIGRWRRLSPRGAFVVTILVLYGVVLYGLAANVGYVSARHSLTPLTAAFGHVGAALLMVAGALPRSRRTLAVALLLAAIAGIGLGKALRPDRTDGLAERRVAEWMRAQGLPPAGVAVRRHRVAYYAGALYVEIPQKRHRDPVRKLRKRGAEYLIITDADVGSYPGLADALPGRARLLHRETLHGVTASLYALLPEGDSPTESAPPSP